VSDLSHALPRADGQHVLYDPAAVHVPVPNVHQPEGYSCGAACTMAVLSYFGVGAEDYAEMKERLGTTREGTDFPRIVEYAARFARHGIRADAEIGMTLGRLEEYLRAGSPVICSIQAYGTADTDEGDRQMYARNECGHYVVAVGFDDRNIYFMDPMLIGERGFIPRAEFVERWHDDEGVAGVPDPVVRLGLVFRQEGQVARHPYRARKVE
jgi:predicted double-glycine peptidase